MSVEELTSKIRSLNFRDRALIAAKVQKSLTREEIDVLWVEEAEQVLDLIDADKMRVISGTELRKRRVPKTTP